MVFFDEGITLAGFHVPSPEISVSKAIYLEVGLQLRRAKEKQDFRLIVFLSDEEGAMHSFEVPPGYGWLPPSEWRNDEVFVGRFTSIIDKSLGPGLYDLGFVVLAADGRVIPVALPAEPAPGKDSVPGLPAGVVVGGREGAPARFAVGEVRFEDVIRIGPPGTGEKAAKDDFQRALAKAEEGRCDEAESQWRLAWRHIPRATKWHDEHRELLRGPLAACWARAARTEGDLVKAADHLAQARVWDHRQPLIWEVAEQVGGSLYEQGLAARADKRWDDAFTLFLAALRADTRLSWARRYAEEARDYRLGIDPESVAAEEAEREDRLRRLREDQARRKAEREGDGDGNGDELAEGEGGP